MREIEEEFGEPFWDVVRGLAEMGYGKGTVAKTIGWDVSGFFRLLKAERPDIQWPAFKDMRHHHDRLA